MLSATRFRKTVSDSRMVTPGDSRQKEKEKRVTYHRQDEFFLSFSWQSGGGRRGWLLSFFFLSFFLVSPRFWSRVSWSYLSIGSSLVEIPADNAIVRLGSLTSKDRGLRSIIAETSNWWTTTLFLPFSKTVQCSQRSLYSRQVTLSLTGWNVQTIFKLNLAW